MVKKLFSALIFRPVFAVLVTVLAVPFFIAQVIFGLVQALITPWHAVAEYERVLFARWGQMMKIVWAAFLNGFRQLLPS